MEEQTSFATITKICNNIRFTIEKFDWTLKSLNFDLKLEFMVHLYLQQQYNIDLLTFFA